MKTNTRSRFTLEASIKTGQSKVEGKIIRCANKGITDIGKYNNSSSIEKLFISTNLIKSLSGIEEFFNLKVLSISYNEIQNLSDVKFLKSLHCLETINMEGNPITQLPYYQHHVFSSVPTIKFLDGKNVTDKLKNTAQQTVEYDINRLKVLSANEIRIQELEDLAKFKGEHNRNWALLVQGSLDQRDFDSFNFTEDEQNEKFDRMREVALELRIKDTSTLLNKWNLVYDKIENVQNQVINEYSNNLKNEMISILGVSPNLSSKKQIVSSRKSSKPNSRSSSNQSSPQEMNSTKLTPPEKINFSEKQRIKHNISPTNNYCSPDILPTKNPHSSAKSIQKPTDKSKLIANKKSFQNIPPDQMTPPTHDNNNNYSIKPLPEEITASVFGSQCISKLNESYASNDSLVDSVIENGVTLSPSPKCDAPKQHIEPKQINIEQVLAFYHSKKIIGNIFYYWKELSEKYSYLDRLYCLYKNQKMSDLRISYFQKWWKKYMSNQRNKSFKNRLAIAYTLSKHVPYKPINVPQEADIALLEKAQLMAEEISKLQALYEEAEQKNNDIRRALDESILNEEKLKNTVRKLTKEKNDLHYQFSKSESNYEQEVVQFILENRFKYDQQKQKLSDLDLSIKQKDLDIMVKLKAIDELHC